MSLKSRRICKCCGKEYEYCPHCGSHSDELWKNLTDTKECLAVFNIVAAYNVGRANVEQVRKVLKDNKITDYSTFNPAIVAALDKINKPAEVHVEKETTKVTSEPVVEVPVKAVESSEVQQPEVQHESVPRNNRNGKKKYRRNTDIGL